MNTYKVFGMKGLLTIESTFLIDAEDKAAAIELGTKILEARNREFKFVRVLKKRPEKKIQTQ